MRKDKIKHWTTCNEQAYIEHLVAGTYVTLDNFAKDPVMLLDNYIKSAKRRQLWGTWDGVNSDKVIKYAEKCLKRLEKQIN